MEMYWCPFTFDGQPCLAWSEARAARQPALTQRDVQFADVVPAVLSLRLGWGEVPTAGSVPQRPERSRSRAHRREN